MLETICLIILVLSFLGLAIIMVLKIPALVELPERGPVSLNCKKIISDAQGQIRKSPPLKGISFDLLLQKILSRTRVLILKTDNRTSSWLQQLRAQSQKRKFGENDNYWQEIKKSTKKSKKA